MELIRDAELGIIGERYATFSELYRENERRFLNNLASPRGDGAARALFEADAGVMFTPQDTKQALLYGCDLYDERFKQAQARATDVLGERYEWMQAPRASTDVQGQHVIVERFAAGHPEAFRRKRPQLRQKRSVNILYDAMCSASTSTAARIEAGCCMLAAAEALELLGYEVALTFVLAKYSGQPGATDPTLVLEVTLKDYGEPLNSKRMQFALAGKPVLFHLGCWWAHRCPTTPIDYGEGEGYPISYDKGRIAAMEQHAERLRGVYVSEDMVEIRMHMDPVKVLEHIVGGLDADEELVAHMRAKTPIAVASQPEQGKLFGGWKAGGEEPSAAEGQTDDAIREQLGANELASADAAVPVGHERGNDGELPASKTQRESKGVASRVGAQTAPSEDPRAVPMQEQAGGMEPGAHVPRGGVGSGMHAQVAQGIPRAPEFPKGPLGGDAERAESTPSDEGERPGDASSEEGDAEEDRNRTGGESPGSGSGADQAGQGDEERPGEQNETSADGQGEPLDQEADAGHTPEPSGEGDPDPSADDDEVLDISKAEDAESEAEDEADAMKETQTNEEHEQDEFIVMLRKRFVQFENGEYLQYMIQEKAARRQAEKAEQQARETGVPAPPSPAERIVAPMGAPRNTPFSMSYLP